MSHWFRVYDDLVDDPKVQRLPARTFKAKLLARFKGEENEFSRWVKVCRGRPTSPLWKDLRSKVFDRDNYTCAYCGARGGKLECDHILPVSRGGTDDLRNLNAACLSCNRSKRNKTLQEWQR